MNVQVENTEADRPGAVAMDVHCVACGYNLRGLDRAGQCPECGAAVARALAGDVLRNADPGWLRGITRGATLFFYGAAALLLLVFGTPVLLSIMINVSIRGAEYALENVFKACALVCLLLLIWGCWLLTRQEPRVAMTERETSLRNLTRVVLLLAMAALLSFFFLSVPYQPAAVGLFLMFSYVGLLGCLRHLQHIAGRIPDLGQATRLRTRFVELLCAGLFFGVLFGLQVAASKFAALSVFSARFWLITYNISILALFLVVARALWATAAMRTALRKVLTDAGIA